MTNHETIERIRAGQPYLGEIGPFVSPSPDALSSLAAELRQNPSTGAREQVVKILVNIATQTDPWGTISHRQILSILLNDASLRVDDAYRFALDRIAALGAPKVLGEFAPLIGRLVEEAPLSELFLVVAKAKAIEAMGSMQSLENDPAWANEDSFRIAQAALGDESIEDLFTVPFLSSSDPKEKIDLAMRLAWIGTGSAMALVAQEMRSPLVVHVPGSFEFSIRPEIAKALHFAHPDQAFLGRIESDEDYERIERWCEFQYGTKWSRPRPPFLTMRSLAR